MVFVGLIIDICHLNFTSKLRYRDTNSRYGPKNYCIDIGGYSASIWRALAISMHCHRNPLVLQMSDDNCRLMVNMVT